MSLLPRLRVPRGADPRPGRALRHGLVLAGLLFAAYLFVVMAPRIGTFGYDAWSYWTVSFPHPYATPLGGLGSFPYPPPIALGFGLADLVPWWVFLFGWTCLGIATVLWLGGRWSAYLFAFPPVAIELYHGNIHLLLAAAVWLGFRHPAAWAFPLLAKPTVGVGLVWFLVRGEWRPLLVAVGTAVAVAVISLLAGPALWGEWVSYAMANIAGTPGGPTIGLPLWLRLPAAAVLVAWGARTDRPWTVPVGSTLALPVLWVAGLSMLVAAVPAWRHAGRLTAPASRSARATPRLQPAGAG